MDYFNILGANVREAQDLCVTVMFCWVWWYCVPKGEIAFVPCVQKGAIRC